MSAIDTALSGLRASETRLAVSANNIANQFSEKSRIDGKTVDKPYTPQKVDSVTLSTGAVQAKVRDVNPATVPVPDTDSRNRSGTKQVPNVHQDEEIVNQIIAALAYKANLAVIKAAKKLDQSLLDIKS